MSNMPPKPLLLKTLAQNIPAELQATPRWIVWRLEWHAQASRWTKLPYSGGGVARINDPACYLPFSKAVGMYGNGNTYDGIGIVLDGSDDLVGVDIDKVKEHLHQPSLSAIYETLCASGTYMERSPGGKGIRAFLRGTFPFPENGRNNRELGVEIYRSGRFLTVTGQCQVFSGAGGVIHDELALQSIGWYVSPSPSRPPAAKSIAANILDPAVSMSDADLLIRARNAKNGKAFALLFDGKREEYYLLRNEQPKSQSEADLSLCKSLAFWTNKNAQQIDRLFRQSGLMRAKWDELRGEKSYGQRTIEKAIAECGETYCSALQSSEFNVVDLSHVVPQPLEWLWPDFFALGKVSLIAGNPGLGKSQIALDVAARVSTGRAWPTGEQGEPGDVILICGEDDAADTIVPRLQAAGADLTRIKKIDSVITRNSHGEVIDRTLSLELDIKKLGELLKQMPETRLIVIDPISAYLGNVDSHNNAEVRGLLEPLAKLAQCHGVAILLISHLNKGSGEAIYRTSGSIAFPAIARSAFIVVKDDSQPERRHLLPTKNNLSRDSIGIGFEVKQAPNGAPYIEWDRATVNGDDLQSLLDITPADEGARLREAKEWLREKLSNGAVASKQIAKDARNDGIAPRTLDRAKARLKVEARKIGATWSWQMPGHPALRAVPDAVPALGSP